MTDFVWLSDEQWSRIRPLLPTNGKVARRALFRKDIPQEFSSVATRPIPDTAPT